jgi:hypothetical protein
MENWKLIFELAVILAGIPLFVTQRVKDIRDREGSRLVGATLPIVGFFALTVVLERLPLDSVILVYMLTANLHILVRFCRFMSRVLR